MTEKLICASQFMFNAGGTLRIISLFVFFLTQMCTKRLMNMCAKFWENIRRLE